MAFPNDSSRIAQGIQNLEASTTGYTSTAPTGSAKAARSLIRKTYCLEVPTVFANGDNAIVANAAPGIRFAKPVRVMGVTCLPRSNSTANILSYQTFSLKPVSNVGVIGNTIATITTQTVASGGTGNLAQGTPFSLVVSTTTNNNLVAAGGWVGVAVAPTSSGIVVSAMTWAIDVEEEGPDGYAV